MKIISILKNFVSSSGKIDGSGHVPKFTVLCIFFLSPSDKKKRWKEEKRKEVNYEDLS